MASKRESDAELLKELQEKFTYASTEWRPIRAEGAIDMRFIGGNHWEPRDEEARKDAGRPCLSLDELSQYVNQLINEIRQNKRAIQVTPMGVGADADSARLRADLIRQIEYRSNAQMAYTTMFENTVQRSYGFLRIQPKYVSEKGFDQELVIKAVVNPDLVLPDPDIQTPDGSDMGYLFELEWMSHSDFTRRWPDATVQDFANNDIKAQAPAFIKDRQILVVGYWRKYVARTRALLLVQTTEGPLEVYADELEQKPSKEQILKSRKVDEYKVCQHISNGLEILETNDWPGQDIPFVCCFGKVLYADEGGGSKRAILSMIRLARDPQMLYDFYRTGEAEQVGMSTKFPYFAYEGQLSATSQMDIQKSLHEPVAVIQVKPTVDGVPPGTVLPLPQRNPFEPAIQALEIGAEGARRAIQAAIGQSPLPSSAQRRNEKSGIALKTIDEAAQKGSYHFIDHYESAVTRTGAILNDLLPYYYDTPRDVTVRGEDDNAKQIRINDPSKPDPKTQKVPAITPDQHDVTLSTGPSYDSERELASDFVDTLVQNLQMVAGVSGPKAAAQVLSDAIRLKNLGAIGTKIADTVFPPEAEGGPAPIPPQVQQQMQQLQMENQQLKQLADKNMADIHKAKIAAASDLDKAHIDQDTRVKVAGIQAEASAYAADVKAGLVDMQTRLAQMESLIGLHVDASAQALDHQHELRMAQMQQQHAMQQGQMNQDHALEQGEQGQLHAMEQAEQQAALQPPVDEANA